jgi:methanethiol S-methyltransferase
MLDTGFLWMLLATGAYGLLHSWLASHALKGWVETHLGLNARRFYRLGYILVSAFALLPLALLGRLLPDRALYTIPFPWILLTLGLQAASAFGLLVAVSQTDTLSFLGLRQISQPAALLPEQLAPERAGLERNAPKLVTGGLYRFVRHPIYSFTLVALWCIPLVSWNILAMLLGLSIYVLVGALFEERKLIAEYGDVYRTYRRKTPMLFPRIW